MKNSIKFSAVILSAGYSSRMGALKPLLYFGEQSALEILVNTYSQCGIKDIIVVVGYNAEEIMKSGRDLKVRWVINSKYREGMYSSIKAGVTEIDADSRGFFLNPVDVPLIKRNTIESLKMEYLKEEKQIIYPSFNEERGHPPLISAEYNKHILQYDGNGGLKRLLDYYEQNSIELPVVDWGSVKDMDTTQDYNELKQYYALQNVPNEEECRAIWNKYKLPLEIVEHCIVVAEVACDIGKTLLEAGINIDLNKIKASALLHDIGRKEKKHAEVGADILKSLGYIGVAEIIKEHMDINTNIQHNEQITEKEIVYLADKMVLGKCIVPFKERFHNSMVKYGQNVEAIERITTRMKNCEAIAEKINRITKKR